MDPKVTAAHETNLKRGFDEAGTSGWEASFDLKKVKRELDVGTIMGNVLLSQLQINRVPELTPDHKCNAKLEFKLENGFSGYDSTPTDSECPSPSFDMGKSFDKLIAKGRAEFIKVRERIESERAAKLESKKSDDAAASWSSWWVKRQNNAKEKMDNTSEVAKSKIFCLKCKRYGHVKYQCRNAFQHRYPQKYLNENPWLRKKLREDTIRRSMAMKNRGIEHPSRRTHHPHNNNRFPIRNRHSESHAQHRHPEGHAQRRHPEGDAQHPHPNPHTTSNFLQLNQITEVVNQILQNQIKMINNQQAQVSYENFDVSPKGYRINNKPWNNNRT